MKRFLFLLFFLIPAYSVCINNSAYVWNYTYVNTTQINSSGLLFHFSSVPYVTNVSQVLNVTGTFACQDSLGVTNLVFPYAATPDVPFWNMLVYSVDSSYAYPTCSLNSTTTWWNATFQKRIQYDFDLYNSAELINTSYRLNVSLGASGFMPNLTNIVFTMRNSSTGEYPIGHYVENYTSYDAKVWVNLPKVSADNSTIVYLYFDNSSLAFSAYANTTFFSLVEDFEDGNDNGWSTIAGAPTAVINSIYPISGRYSYRISVAASAGRTRSCPITTRGFFAKLMSETNSLDAANDKWGFYTVAPSTNGVFMTMQEDNTLNKYYRDGAAWVDSLQNWVVNTTHTVMGVALYENDIVSYAFDGSYIANGAIGAADNSVTSCSVYLVRASGTIDSTIDDIFMGNFDVNNTRVSNSSVITYSTSANLTEVYVAESDMDLLNNFYNLTNNYERNNTLMDYANMADGVAEVSCPSSSDNITFTDNYKEIITIERPKWVAFFYNTSIDGVQTEYYRTQIINSGYEEVRGYFLDYNEDPFYRVEFLLAHDDPSEWANSNISLKRYYSTGIETIASFQTDIENKAVFYLKAFKDYYFFLTGATETRGLGFFIPEASGVKVIDLRQVSYFSGQSLYEKIFFNQTWDDPWIYFRFYDTENTVTNISWWVWNATSEIYYMSTAFNQFTFLYNASDSINQTVVVGFVGYSSKYGSFYFNQSMDLGDVGTDLGLNYVPSFISSAELERGLVLFLCSISLIFTLTNSMMGGVVIYGLIFLFKYAGFLPSITLLDMSVIAMFMISSLLIPRKKVNA